ncbi:PotD/PotF family extracellular solute-binding protein [Paenibacillus sp. XY044]|uniref:ABC transporter substrate-binding protein n=1 Tax=Paenibacillus sp. XY044 TaxID=2026089 RepID=UPI000B991120|nr:ABC transporter substrate-binding protein [Paenibacillus sp. XY044]OZB92223.1 ABC transporter ATP-binding protein [Paenibacillus sp. XY044]
MTKKKKFAFGALLLSLTLIVSACGGQASNTEGAASGELPKTNKVVIGVSGGDWEKNIRQAALDKFEKETGIDVEVVTGTDAEWYPKLKAGNGKNAPYDVLILQPDTIQRAAGANLLQPLDTKNVPNLADLYPSVEDRFTKDGNIYAAGFSMGQLGIVYRKDLVKTPPTKWTDLWNPEFQGHVAVSSPTYSAGLQFFSGLVHALGGQESNAADVDKAFTKLADLKQNAVAFPDNSGSIQTLLERGDAWLVPFWDGRAFAMQDSGLDVGFVYPEDGPVAAVASWAIPKGSKNLANAYKLVDYLSSPDTQKAFSDLSLYGMTNKNVQYSDTLKQRVQVGEEAYKKLTWVDYATATPKLAEWTDRWTQALGGGK